MLNPVTNNVNLKAHFVSAGRILKSYARDLMDTITFKGLTTDEVLARVRACHLITGNVTLEGYRADSNTRWVAS